VTVEAIGLRGANVNHSEAAITFGDVYETVAGVVAESLNVDEGEVTPEAALQRDLGAESIDLLDIVFRLEKAFRIPIPRGELFPESVFQNDAEFVSDGRVTDAGMAELRARLPFADLEEFDHDRRLMSLPDLFTVGLIARYVARRLSVPATPVPIAAH
jgi:acyl carrier protein